MLLDERAVGFACFLVVQGMAEFFIRGRGNFDLVFVFIYIESMFCPLVGEQT
jgi:hypothetical protein